MKTSFLDSTMPITSRLTKLFQAETHRLKEIETSLPEPKPAPGLGRFKYIIVHRQGFDAAIVLPEFVNHSDAINKLDCPPISAGFAWRDADGKVHVEGISTSLGLQSRPQDAEIIRETLFMNGL